MEDFVSMFVFVVFYLVNLEYEVEMSSILRFKAISVFGPLVF